MFGIFHYQGDFYSTYEEVDSEVRKICRMLGEQRYRFTRSFIFLLDFTLRELFNNAVEHGNLLHQNAKVRVWICYHDQTLEIKVGDAGKGFELTPLTTVSPSEDYLPQRNRGLASVQVLGFELRSDHGLVNARLNLAGTSYLDESEEK